MDDGLHRRRNIDVDAKGRILEGPRRNVERLTKKEVSCLVYKERPVYCIKMSRLQIDYRVIDRVMAP